MSDGMTEEGIRDRRDKKRKITELKDEILLRMDKMMDLYQELKDLEEI